ncbi:ShlB/FhaC/HecB family hemolysin secretion/activation protein [Pseudomonas sp. LJDD11]|uniref:ShlB/FhaC/HecB family hemolysin secretion/activation protein n=1 Tax=Pseudomonas sp. LJDD11 TaxID=2931984 RepID=UPI00211B767E|nr:ShlB/FhaC/HecB family hemolysin secretion/activation protein [Pseudomonas sp. LJDD11]MCQ9424354.1 ShlB/FhaC/HecB family hemolysin secretion/activation protein [Pseudomonas sp. LJDD11]
MASCTLVFGLASQLPAHAAGLPTPGEQDLIRDRQDRLLEEQRRRLEELKTLPGQQAEPSAPSAATEQRCFDIQRIELKGAESLSEAERKKLVSPWVGKCLGVPQLNEVLKAITDHYLNKGMVTTRAYLPQQDLSQGVLHVLVVEGKLEKLGSEGPGKVSERELAMTFPGKPGEVLNLRDIEQMVDQFNRLPSRRVQTRLTPGQAIGGSNVLVDNRPDKPWRASLSRHNDGQRSTGEQQWSTGLEWDSPLGLADQLRLRGGHDALSDHRKTSKNFLMGYEVPWGWWNFSYYYSESDYRALGQASTFDFKQSGDSQSHQLRAERVIHRDALSKTSINTGLSHLRTNNYINDEKLGTSSNRITEAQFGITHGRRVGGSFVNIDLGMQQGIGALDAQGDHDPNGNRPGPGIPTARYRKYTATVSYLYPFQLWGERLTFSSLATGQHSEDALYSPQRLSLGGVSSVRGFKDQYLSGDSGGYWRNELRLTRPVGLDWLRPAFSEYGAAIGYDQGVISNDRYNGAQHGRLSGHSFELFARGRNVATSVTFAHSLERPSVIERESPVYFRIDFFL